MKDSEYFYLEAKTEFLKKLPGIDLTDAVQEMRLTEILDWAIAFQERDRITFFETVENLILRLYREEIETLALELEHDYREDQKAQARQDWIEAKRDFEWY